MDLRSVFGAYFAIFFKSLQRFQGTEVMIRAKRWNETRPTSPQVTVTDDAARDVAVRSTFCAFFPSLLERRVLRLAALEPVGGPRRLPSVRGRQRALREHHGEGSRHHGLEKHLEGLLHPRRHHHHRTAAAGPRHVRGENQSARAPVYLFVRLLIYF